MKWIVQHARNLFALKRRGPSFKGNQNRACANRGLVHHAYRCDLETRRVIRVVSKHGHVATVSVVSLRIGTGCPASYETYMIGGEREVKIGVHVRFRTSATRSLSYQIVQTLLRREKQGCSTEERLQALSSA